MDKLAAQALCAIESHQMLKNGDTVIVACSGGADSMALLHFLFCHRQRLGIALRAAHVNHGLRGAASDADAAFVEDYCESHDIPLDTKRLVPNGSHSEQWAREQRYAFFFTLCARYENAKIATAHTQNDNAETVLLHLARGAGLHGACGIPAVRGAVIRPFLTVTRAQVEHYVRENGLAHCTDETNTQPQYARNRVRSGALPALQSVNPQAGAALTRFAQHAAQAVDYLTVQAHMLLRLAQWSNCVGEEGYRAAVLTAAHPAVRTAALHGILSCYADVTQARLALAEEAVCRGSGAVQLSESAVFTAAQGIVRVVHAPDGAAAAAAATWQRPFFSGRETQTIVLPNDFVLRVVVCSYEKTVNFQKQEKNLLKFAADYGKINSNATFRTFRTGDTFAPAQGNGTKPLKKMYSEAKLSAFMRRENPVLASGSRVLWAAGFGFAKGLLPDETTKRFLRIEIKCGLLPHNSTGGDSHEHVYG